MASGPYSFIDIAVIEEVRARFAAGDALAILSVDLDEVIWANGAGAALFGYPDIEAIMGASARLGLPARRQISATPGYPRIGRDRPVLVRLASGATSRAIAFLASSVTLPDGEPAVLLAAPAQAPGGINDGEIAARIIGGFEEAGYFAALIGEDAGVMAASDGFADLGISEGTLNRLVGEVARQDDRLVKRMVRAGDRLIPAGMARLTDAPPVHLLIAIDDREDDETEAPAEREPEPPSATESKPAEALRPNPEETARAMEAPAPSDADIVDLIEEGEAVIQQRLAGQPFSIQAKDAGGAPHTAGPEHSDADDWYFSHHPTANENIEPAERQPADEPFGRRHTPPVPQPIPASGPIRFIWRTDADGAFSAISPEFIGAVGPLAADIIGRTFRDVAMIFGLDPDGEIAGLLDRRDTWSGRSVPWPIAGTDLKVPVDLAALPIYDRNRVFEGFRGFGVVRMGDAATDPDALGLTLTGRTAETDGEPKGVAEAPAETPESTDFEPRTPDNDPFKGEVPVISIASRRERRLSDKIIRLAERRPAGPEKSLSPGERNALEEIRERLRKDYEAAKSLDEAETPEEEESAPEDTAPTAKVEAEDATARGGDAAEPGDAGHETFPAEPLDREDLPAAAAEASEDAGASSEPQEEQQFPMPEAETKNAADEAGASNGDDETGAADDVHAEAQEEVAEQEAAADDAATGERTMPSRPVAQPSPGMPIATAGFTPSAFSTEAGYASGVDADLIAGLPLPALVHAGDRLHFANREFLKLTGYASLHQIEREGGLDRLFVDREGGETIGPEGSKLRLRTLGGEEFPVDAHLQSIRWGGGKALLLALQKATPDRPAPVAAPVMATGAADGQQEAEDGIAEMRAIIDTATDGVVLIANDGTIRNISRPAEALFGFDSAEVEGKPFSSLFAIESQRAARDYLAGLAENGVASVLNDGREVIGREAEGRFIPLFMTIGRLPNEGGFCAVVRDITQWKRAEEDLTQARSQAERASSQKTEFLARVSHEIRTPLNAIIGFSELMMDEKFGPIGSDRYRDYLRDINRSGNHVLDLVNDLLDISKIEAGEQEMNYEAVSLNDTLAESVAMMQPQANRERVIIRSSLASRLPEVVADLRSVRQIALNLLSNAIRYTQAGGQVIVSTSYETSGDVVMRVRDTGIGMTLAEIDQAMKPFKQINALKRGRHDGTGLGLPLTKAMVEANRARFAISSNPGDGTLVEITFPSTRVLAT